MRTKTITDYTTAVTDGITEHKFVYSGIAAKEMFEIVRAKLVIFKGGVRYESAVDEYSVQTYAYSRLSKTKDAAFRTLLVDLLNYGAAAQTYFRHHPSALVNASLTDRQRAWGTQADVSS